MAKTAGGSPSSDGGEPSALGSSKAARNVYGFLTTAWTVVSQARHGTAGSREAMAKLVDMYWQPVFRFARRRLPSDDEAEDFTQDFFEKFLGKSSPLAKADSSRGSLRGFLLQALKWQVINHWEQNSVRSKREKSLSSESIPEPVDSKPRLSDENELMYGLAVGMVRAAAVELRQDYASHDSRSVRRLRVYDDLLAETPIAKTAESLGISLDAVKRCRKAVKDELWRRIAAHTSFEGDPEWDRKAMGAILAILRSPET